MSKMKDFRSIADEAMKDINVSCELKVKTMQQCTKRNHVPLARLLVPAACLILAVIVGLPGILRPKTPIEEQNPEMNIMMGDNSSTKPYSGQDISLMTAERPVETLDEAKKAFGEAFLTPTYIPEGFTLERIDVTGEAVTTVSGIVLTYVSGEKSFWVIEEKTEKQERYENYKEVDIHGETGYLNPDLTWNNENVPDTKSNESKMNNRNNANSQKNTNIENSTSSQKNINSENNVNNQKNTNNENSTSSQKNTNNENSTNNENITNYEPDGSFVQDEMIEDQINEVHWYKNKVHYSVGGLITEKEAVDIAISMK